MIGGPSLPFDRQAGKQASAVAAWVAVALATAIRLFAPAFLVPTIVAVTALAIVAIVAGRSRAVRVVALLLGVVALTDAATLIVLRVERAQFPVRSRMHLDREANRIREGILATESRLDATTAKIADAIQRTGTARTELFHALRSNSLPAGAGVRIVAPNGDLLAWWGDELRVNGDTSYAFDATSLYVTRARALTSPALKIEAFQRIVNESKAHSIFDPDDDWLAGSVFHAGVLRAEPGVRRYLIARRPDSTLFVDLIPRSIADVTSGTRVAGADVSAVILAAAALLLLLLDAPLRSRPAAMTLLVIVARTALLQFSIADDPTHLFDYALYGSRFFRAFSRSPADLLLTGSAFLAIFAIWSSRLARFSSRALLIGQTIAAFAAGYGIVMLVRNLVDNSRISAVPDHIIPASLAQGVLLGSLLLFGFAALLLTRHASTLRSTLIAIATALVPILLIAYALGLVEGVAFLSASLAMAIALIVSSLTAHRVRRLILEALLMVLVIFIPLQLFEIVSARRFIAETYAPLVAGESGQLREMIENTLRNDFSRTDLASLLPDEYTRMDLQDLAYALWRRSDLSKWRVPAVITIRDVFEHPISRFGVGLPQFNDRRSADVAHEVLQLGSLRRVLIHHDFEITVGGIPIGEGSVHVVNPADPGATTFGDVYRAFFEPSADDSATSLRAQREPVVYERNGSVHGTPVFRLPQSASWYFAALKPGAGMWENAVDAGGATVYLRRADNALYAFPLQVPSIGQRVRRAGGLAIWAIAFVVATLALRSLPLIIAWLRDRPHNINFRTRTSVYIAAVVVIPLIIFVIFVRTYLAGRLEQDYIDRGQTALNTAQRVIEDYLASTNATTRPEQLLDDEVLSWLSLVIGHDLHLYRDEQLIASSRRDLFAAHVESERLPGNVYSAIVLHGRQLYRDTRQFGSSQYIEIYSPMTLTPGENYTLALPFIVQGRQINNEVNDLATSIYMLLVFVVLASIAVAFRTAASVTRPVQALVVGARAVARGQFEVDLKVPSDPDLGLLVTTFRDMAQSIRRQQSDLRHERDRLQTLLENINAAVVVLDGSGFVSATNLAARKLFGEDVGFPPEMQEFLAGRGRKGIVSNELDLNVSGNTRTFRVSLAPLPDSDEDMLIAEDVTEILRSNRLEAWGEMARQVAHEIKNPLTPIQLTAEHLRAVAERNDENLVDLVKASVENILRQVVTLRETSKEFSDYASLRQVRKKPVNLKHLLEELAAGYRSSAHQGIDFRADIDPSTPSVFQGDERLLRGAIANLIENAFQAAPGGRVRLGSYGVDSKVVVAVEDSGPGVPNELIGKIFDPYFSTKSSGTGLGLAIARKAVEEHGGHVHAENLHPGFRISVELPVTAARSAE